MQLIWQIQIFTQQIIKFVDVIALVGMKHYQKQK